MDLLRENVPQRKKLDGLRVKVAAVHAEIEAVIQADAADEDLREHCRRAVRGVLDYTRWSRAQFDPLRQSDALVQSLDFEGMKRIENSQLPDLSWSALILLVGEDRAVELVFAAAKRGATSAPGLPNAERENKIAELREQVRELERAEELETLAVEAAGHHILRRDDADPQVLFEVWASHTAA